MKFTILGFTQGRGDTERGAQAEERVLLVSGLFGSASDELLLPPLGS